MKLIKVILVAIPLILLTGCISIETIEENDCYRFIDYNNNEHYAKRSEDSCWFLDGGMFCSKDGTNYSVVEYEKIECPTEVQE